MNSGKKIKRIVIKIGSNVLTDSRGLLDNKRIESIVKQICEIREKGIEVILVSSGAVAAGKGVYLPKQKIDAVGLRQMWSSLGQVQLIQIYGNLFNKYRQMSSQVLVTREDFRSRDHYLNMKNCFSVLISNEIIPIVNENDVVSVTELMFTDNDELAGLVATMLNVDLLIMLTTVDGILYTDPIEGQKVIREITSEDRSFEKHVKAGKSTFGRGGMLTKTHIASKVAGSGIEVKIANGSRANILTDLLADRAINTRFIPAPGRSNIKKWLSHAKGFEKGSVGINMGAKEALLSERATSLLPVGITKVEGNFNKGDLILIYDDENNQIGLGIAQYNDVKARQKAGVSNQRPLVHYDYLFLL